MMHFCQQDAETMEMEEQVETGTVMTADVSTSENISHATNQTSINQTKLD